MASLKEIRGIDIEVRTSDPENPESGQVWYNTTTELIKGYKQVVGTAWATGGSLNTARNSLAGAGTQTSALGYGGLTSPGNSNVTGATETYNGSSWTEVNNLNSARQQLGDAGTSTAALGVGGFDGSEVVLSVTELWNGSSWTEVGD